MRRQQRRARHLPYLAWLASGAAWTWLCCTSGRESPSPTRARCSLLGEQVSLEFSRGFLGKASGSRTAGGVVAWFVILPGRRLRNCTSCFCKDEEVVIAARAAANVISAAAPSRGRRETIQALREWEPALAFPHRITPLGGARREAWTEEANQSQHSFSP